MTFREKLEKEHPECVSGDYIAGCKYCPCDYGYELSLPCGTQFSCRSCWDREIPMTPEEQEAHDLRINEEILLGYCDQYQCTNCPANRVCDPTDGNCWDAPDYNVPKQMAVLNAFESALPPLDEDDAERTDTPQNDTNTPDNIVRHARVCTELNELYKRKNADYGDSFHKSYEEWGLTMAAVRLCDKYSRFAQLVHQHGNAHVKDESMRDTLIDLANYAIMTVMELDMDAEQKRN